MSSRINEDTPRPSERHERTNTRERRRSTSRTRTRRLSFRGHVILEKSSTEEAVDKSTQESSSNIPNGKNAKNHFNITGFRYESSECISTESDAPRDVAGEELELETPAAPSINPTPLQVSMEDLENRIVTPQDLMMLAALLESKAKQIGGHNVWSTVNGLQNKLYKAVTDDNQRTIPIELHGSSSDQRLPDTDSNTMVPRAINRSSSMRRMLGARLP
ncbi:hypothetical protein M426DRAFT_321520 [Hypoxylon sp. CI-4A]|nr:hypothetical protein M426DRAFT_321520 [Hypoxylon sp. CI-4A]